MYYNVDNERMEGIKIMANKIKYTMKTEIVTTRISVEMKKMLDSLSISNGVSRQDLLTYALIKTFDLNVEDKKLNPMFLRDK